MGSLDGNCEVHSSGGVTTDFPHMIATTCERTAVAEVDITLPACPAQPNPPLMFRVKLCDHHIAAYTGWH